jgi:hypothetical protein
MIIVVLIELDSKKKSTDLRRQVDGKLCLPKTKCLNVNFR